MKIQSGSIYYAPSFSFLSFYRNLWCYSITFSLFTPLVLETSLSSFNSIKFLHLCCFDAQLLFVYSFTWVRGINGIGLCWKRRKRALDRWDWVNPPLNFHLGPGHPLQPQKKYRRAHLLWDLTSLDLKCGVSICLFLTRAILSPHTYILT